MQRGSPGPLPPAHRRGVSGGEAGRHHNHAPVLNTTTNDPHDRAPASCPDCGAPAAGPGDGCQERFLALLALDHSHRAPWGPLHGLAFAAFALQHPSAYDHAALERAWIGLWRITRRGDDPVRLFAAMRREGSSAPEAWDVPPLPAAPPAGGPYAVTIMDLGDFEASTYNERALDWARAVVDRWEAGARREPAGSDDDGTRNQGTGRRA